eukprot:922961-Pleurochrysis_carterae.AAC.1
MMVAFLAWLVHQDIFVEAFFFCLMEGHTFAFLDELADIWNDELRHRNHPRNTLLDRKAFGSILQPRADGGTVRAVGLYGMAGPSQVRPPRLCYGPVWQRHARVPAAQGLKGTGASLHSIKT